MSKKVEKIEIVFENCESLTIYSGFGIFHIGDIKEEINRVAVNAILQTKTAHKVFFQLSKKCNCDKSGLYDKDVNPLTRIRDLNDITSLYVYYDDKSNDQYYVDYDEGDQEGNLGASNKNQKSIISENGNLYVAINKEKGIDDIFVISEIDEEIEVYA